MRRNTYRIITNHGTVDFAITKEMALEKYRKYIIDMEEGYSIYVKLVSVDIDSGAEKTILIKTREENDDGKNH